MIRFEYPEFFLLAVPLWVAYRRWGDAPGPTGWLRLTVAGLLLVALTGPEADWSGRGLDVIVVADRSRSLTSAAHENVRELTRNLEQNRGAGDRLAVVTFGSQPAVEYVLSAEKTLGQYTKKVMPDGSDLYAAISTALNLVDERRPARILILSDGESNGASPLSAARRAREAGVPLDYRLFERVRIGDVAVESIELPTTVAPREPFQFSVWVHAEGDTRGLVRVLCGGQLIASANREFESGMNPVVFRDVLEQGGLHHYSVELEVADDALPENNHGAGVVRVDAGPKLLVLNTDGSGGNLVRALSAGQISVDVAVAGRHPLTLDALDPYRAVIVENVPAAELGRVKMERLAQFVEDLGGGLMLTGGEQSFGSGGYFKSPLDDLLPVSMELREKHRKNRLALAIAMDRSGSMAMPVRGSKTKMDLANLGAAECVRLLAPSDMVAVLAVDESPHLVQPITTVESPDSITARVLTIESGGGGIFIYEALAAAGKELMKADQYATRHIILFADAADSEEPGDYETLLKQYGQAGITASVIGLGTPADPDAALLERIAELGGGNIMFTADAEELPRLFTQDTLSVARSSFIKKDDSQPNGIVGRLQPQARLLGDFNATSFPNADGYNLSYLKPEATAAVISQDEYRAPWSAFWYRGLGRVAAISLEIDGPFSGPFGRWDGYDDFLITHARWLIGGGNPDDLFVQIRREGQDAVVTVELDPERGGPANHQPPSLVVVPPGSEREEAETPEFTWAGPYTLESRFRMNRTGTYHTVVKTTGGRIVRGPAVTLPYSPEFGPRIGLPGGGDTLAEMAALSGGTKRTDVLAVFDDPPRSARTQPLFPWLMGLGIVLLIAEIAGRRLSLWERVQPAAVPEDGRPEAARRRKAIWRLTARKRQAATNGDSEAPTIPTPAREPARQPQPASYKSTSRVFDEAKQRAKRRLR